VGEMEHPGIPENCKLVFIESCLYQRNGDL